MVTFDEAAAAGYDQWFQTPQGALAEELEYALFLRLLRPSGGVHLLDVGCGTGRTLARLKERPVHSVGIDISMAMLKQARKRLGESVPLVAADAAALPFLDQSFDVSLMNTTLEFAAEAAASLQELFRVTRQRVYLGVLNKWSLLGLGRRLRDAFRGGIFRQARFYSLPELQRLIHALTPARVDWASVLVLPSIWGLGRLRRLEHQLAFRKNPFAAYLGIVIEPEG